MIFIILQRKARAGIFGTATTSKYLGDASFPLLQEKGDDVDARHCMRCVAVCRQCSCPATTTKPSNIFTSPLTQQTAKAKPQLGLLARVLPPHEELGVPVFGKPTTIQDAVCIRTLWYRTQLLCHGGVRVKKENNNFRGGAALCRR